MPFIFAVLILADDAPLAIMSSLIIDELGSGELVGGVDFGARSPGWTGSRGGLAVVT